MPNIRTKRKVAQALKRYARSMGNWVKPSSKVRKLSPTAANSFLLGVMFDRSIPYEKAWESGEWINDSFGDAKDSSILWKNLVAIEKKRLRGFLRYGFAGKAFHRHYKTFAKQLPEAAAIIIEKYSGDPRKIWNSRRNVLHVRDSLEELPGIGPALSRMAVLILARNYGLLGGKGALPHLDIKPDIHVMRVFHRAGLIMEMDSTIETIEIAQNLSPKFPAELDAPAWQIGQEWCRPRTPCCDICPIEDECPQKY